jgi:hypothetical protein
MVRVKSRWMICRIDFERDIILNRQQTATTAFDLGINYFPSKKDLAAAIRSNLHSSFGDASSTAASITATQGTFYIAFFSVKYLF